MRYVCVAIHHKLWTNQMLIFPLSNLHWATLSSSIMNTYLTRGQESRTVRFTLREITSLHCYVCWLLSDNGLLAAAPMVMEWKLSWGIPGRLSCGVSFPWGWADTSMVSKSSAVDCWGCGQVFLGDKLVTHNGKKLSCGQPFLANKQGTIVNAANLSRVSSSHRKWVDVW